MSENNPEQFANSAPALSGHRELIPQNGFDWESQDAALRALGAQAMERLGPNLVDDLAIVHQRYDVTGTVRDASGASVKLPHYRLRKVLEVMPDYIENAAQVGVSQSQAYLMLRRMMLVKERSRHSEVEDTVQHLALAFSHQNAHGHEIDQKAQADLDRLLTKAAGKVVGDKMVTAVYSGLSRLGFASQESTVFIEHELHMDTEILSQVARLSNLLSVAKVDVGVFREVCNLAIQDPWHKGNHLQLIAHFTLLKDLIYSVAPAHNMSANDLLSVVLDRLRTGATFDEVASSFKNRPALAPAVAIDVPAERRDKHFNPLPHGQALDIAKLPYRVERSLQDGMEDLGKIAVRPQSYNEGMWVYDAPTSIWYSMGGETNVDWDRNAVRHTYPPFPIADISKELYLFHCHTDSLGRIMGPSEDELQKRAIPQIAVPVLERMNTITPSGRDYTFVAELLRGAPRPSVIRAFIAHALGFTEYTFPNDPDAIEDVGQRILSVREDLTLGETNWQRILFQRKWMGLVKKQRKANDVAVELLGSLERRLPRGFGLRLITEINQ